MNKRERIALLVAVAGSILALSGCATAKKVPQSRLQAIAHNERGVTAQGAGQMERAVAEFTEAYRLHGAIENTDGMIVALVNLARTRRLMGDLAAAREAVERASSLLPEPSGLAAEVHFEMAKVMLASGELSAASRWALQAEGAEKGPARGQRANLVAVILLRQGAPHQALAQAEKALKLARKEDATAEEANALRLLGEIHLAQGNFEKSAESYHGALALDRELGFGRKIAIDLRGLAGATAGKGDRTGAIGFYRRAMEASLHGGHTEVAADDMARLSELYRATGQADIAEKLEAERKTLVGDNKAGSLTKGETGTKAVPASYQRRP